MHMTMERPSAAQRKLPTVLAVGHSNLTSVSDAWRQANEDEKPVGSMVFLQLLVPQYRPLLITEGERTILNPRITQKLEELIALNSPALFASFVLGNDHSVFGLVNHPRPFDFVLPDRHDLGPAAGAEIVPYDMMRAMLADRVKRFLVPMLSSFRTISGLPVRHFCSPPPIGSQEHIAQFPGIAGAKVRSLGVAPPGLRLKLWLMYADIVAEACAEAGVEFVPAPLAAMDAAGFLDQPLWSNTPTHGNAGYGRLVLSQLSARMERLPR
jgi:hypothetical protein